MDKVIKEELYDVVEKSMILAHDLGYKEGVIAMQKKVMNSIKDYADITDTSLFTATDAFRVVLNSLMDGEEGDYDKSKTSG